MSDRFIPYGRQVVEEEDIAAVAAVLRSDWLTTGPTVGKFEQAFAEYVGAKHCVAVSNGTAALHLAAMTCDLAPDDEVIVPALTFAASANCVRYVGARVVFADVRPDTLTIDVKKAEALITPRTRAIVAVDYSGLPADLDEIMALAQRHRLTVIEDAAHAVGATYRDRRVGSIAHLSTFSFHPVKHLTTGEGGMITTNDDEVAARLRRLRNHGIGTDHRQREQQGTWAYDMSELGYNYRLCDIQCALGISQLARIPASVARRRELAARYQAKLAAVKSLILPHEPADRRNSWHLYAVRVQGADPAAIRQKVFGAMRAAGIGVNVHYAPVYQHSYYRNIGYPSGLCPEAERAYAGLISLPMWHGLTDQDQDRVMGELVKALAEAA